MVQTEVTSKSVDIMFFNLSDQEFFGLGIASFQSLLLYQKPLSGLTITSQDRFYSLD